MQIATVAHAGDGNLHPVFIFDRGLAEPPAEVWAAADEVFRAALRLGGTLTGEHGVGLLKRRWLALETGPVARRCSRASRQVFDPLGILNPGKAICAVTGPHTAARVNVERAQSHAPSTLVAFLL